jgi:DNA-binding NarL/FixJ family response regulator
MADKSRAANILIVDDHPIVRQGLRQVIDAESGLSVCCEAESPPEALGQMAKLAPDLVLVDLRLGNSDGLDLIKSIRSTLPATKILVLTMHAESFYAERALRAGADGFLTKQEASENVVGAIRKLLAGEMFVSDRISPKLLRKLITGDGRKADPVERLSDRELQVFRLIGEGLASQEIADALSLSVKTIETYRAHIKEKLELEDARRLVQTAIRWVVDQEAK